MKFKLAEDKNLQLALIILSGMRILVNINSFTTINLLILNNNLINI